MYAVILICSFILDVALGETDKIPHPVVYFGKMIEKSEKFLRSVFPDTKKGKFTAGLIMALGLPVSVYALFSAAIIGLYMINPVLAIAANIFWGYQSLAMTGLKDESMNVHEELCKAARNKTDGLDSESPDYADSSNAEEKNSDDKEKKDILNSEEKVSANSVEKDNSDKEERICSGSEGKDSVNNEENYEEKDSTNNEENASCNIPDFEDKVKEARKDTGYLDAARKAVARIVGRDTANLDEKGITKAAVETVAENFGDGVVSPMTYLAIGGAPLAMAYKMINTMDSMVGYKNEKYMDYGKAAARLDDVAGFIPSRIAAFFLMIGARLVGEDWKNALRIWKRDRYNSSSPNSAQTESAMAGALHIQLGGPASYFGKKHDKPYMGDDDRDIEINDIKRANRVMVMAASAGVVVFVIIRIIIYITKTVNKNSKS